MTPSKEDYLKKIVQLGGENNIVGNKKIADALQVSAASVTEMNARLLKDDYITYTPYKGVQVTKKGLQLANQLICKHRIWELFLVEKLGFDWEEVHEEAELLEHHSSDKLIDRLNEMLGNPKYDPHGGIIPNPDGTMPQNDFIKLTELERGDHFIIREVSDAPEILAYISHKNLDLGNVYQLMEYDSFDEIYILEKEDTLEQILINKKFAEMIKIEVME